MEKERRKVFIFLPCVREFASLDTDFALLVGIFQEKKKKSKIKIKRQKRGEEPQTFAFSKRSKRKTISCRN
jgi:hypothetical protein